MISPRTALGVLQVYSLGFLDAEFLGAAAKKIIESLDWSPKPVLLYRGSRIRSGLRNKRLEPRRTGSVLINVTKIEFSYAFKLHGLQA